MQQKAHILLAPLDWGLGHAARCIPIIEALLLKNVNITVAVNGAAAQLIKNSCPQVKIETNIPNYNISYSKNGFFTKIKLLTQLPKIKKAIKAENTWLKQYCTQHKVDIIISDNRYGFFNTNIFSVFITHQLQPITPLGNWANTYLQKYLYHFIHNFNQCWVYDNLGHNALAGQLSKTDLPNIPTRYIGTHSRLNVLNIPKLYDVAIILSGPEPQRSILEHKLLAQAKHLTLSVCLVRGISNKESLNNEGIKKTYNLADTETINKIVNSSRFIICRSGYSSAMDYLSIGAQCIFIPTPGQTEQLYLAKYLSEKKWAITTTQNNVDLQNIIEKAKIFEFKNTEIGNKLALQKAVDLLPII